MREGEEGGREGGGVGWDGVRRVGVVRAHAIMSETSEQSLQS